ncbi:Transmembrane domain-containing protein [Brazilian cedratvirus IHUMI]|uniref:Transmembrane domain-containing protein n=1 Tax=Brazilian cedratvirus IHUMI TaxID=2126980 RepID=A0A2R8FEX0_9VIRU|nr:Transmembrane domain-containing protein [Brazilian cedratvirus IHUMI]
MINKRRKKKVMGSRRDNKSRVDAWVSPSHQSKPTSLCFIIVVIYHEYIGNIIAVFSSGLVSCNLPLLPRVNYKNGKLERENHLGFQER